MAPGRLIDFYSPWLLRSDAQWLAACRRPITFQKSELAGILPELYALFPQPGAPSHPAIPVIIRHGDQVAVHHHKQWTLILYLALGDPPVPVIIERVPLEPQRGQVILLPPYTAHAVPKSKSLAWRLSLALRWNTEKANEAENGPWSAIDPFF